MDTEQITARVIETIVERLEVPADTLSLETRFVEDLKADSLALMELVLAFEETFDIQANDEDSEKLRSVQDAVDFVTAQLAATTQLEGQED